MRLVSSFAVYFALVSFVTSSTLIKRDDVVCKGYGGGATWSSTSFELQEVSGHSAAVREWAATAKIYNKDNKKDEYYSLNFHHYTSGGDVSISTKPFKGGSPKFRQFRYEVSLRNKSINNYWSALSRIDQCWTDAGHPLIGNVLGVTAYYRVWVLTKLVLICTVLLVLSVDSQSSTIRRYRLPLSVRRMLAIKSIIAILFDQDAPRFNRNGT